MTCIYCGAVSGPVCFACTRDRGDRVGYGSRAPGDEEPLAPIGHSQAKPQPTKRTGPWASEPTPRPVLHLSRLAGRYAKFWHRYEEFRRDRKRLGDWPPWCYCPLAGSYAIVSGGGDNRVPLDRSHLIAELGGLAAWRPTKGIYRFDLDLGKALVDTPLEGELPREILHRLPEWCVYVETTGLVEGVEGFFAHLEHDAGDGRTELRLLLDYGPDDAPQLAAVPLHLVEGGLVASVQAMADEAASQAALEGVGWTSALARGVVRDLAGRVRPLVSLLLYLCSEEPDYAGDDRPRIPRLTKTAKGMRMPTADAPRTWDVGLRIGAAIRAAREVPERADEGGQFDGNGVAHRRPRGHLRRAHWHTYWTGKGKAVPALRWLFPMMVNANSPDGLPAVVRKVRE